VKGKTYVLVPILESGLKHRLHCLATPDEDKLLQRETPRDHIMVCALDPRGHEVPRGWMKSKLVQMPKQRYTAGRVRQVSQAPSSIYTLHDPVQQPKEPYRANSAAGPESERDHTGHLGYCDRHFSSLSPVQVAEREKVLRDA
jgi:hypothetical protein